MKTRIEGRKNDLNFDFHQIRKKLADPYKHFKTPLNAKSILALAENLKLLKM